MRFIKRHKKILIPAAALIAALMISSQFIAVQWWDTRIGENCLSVVFDKHKVKAADKAIFETGETDILVEDKKLIKRIADETLVAVARGYKHPVGTFKIRLYNGGELVRTIELSEDLNVARFYYEDRGHWIFEGSEGWGFLSDQLVSELKLILKA